VIDQVLEVVKGAGEAVPAAELERRLGVSSDDERRALVDALGKLLFDQQVLQFDQQSGGYRTRQGAAP
jgi:hypothetical protein